MKIHFDSVRLEYEIPRFGDKGGFASSTTSHFAAKDGVTIELDAPSGVVRLARGELVRNIPRERVLWFGDVIPAAETAPKPPLRSALQKIAAGAKGYGRESDTEAGEGA